MKNLSLLFVLSLLSLPLTGCFQTRSDIQQEKEQQNMQTSLQQSVADQAQSIEDLQQHVGRLQGRIEEYDHSHKSDAGNEQKAQEDINKKITAILARLDAIEQKQDVLFTEVTKLKQDNLAPRAPLGEISAPQKKSKSGSSFDAAIANYQAHQYAEASAGFTAYLKAGHAKHLVDANYFLGESEYQQKNYSQAILAYNVVHEKGGKTVLGRKATLRIAESFSKMGNHKDAKAFAQLVVDMAPESAEAKTARKFLK